MVQMGSPHMDTLSILSATHHSITMKSPLSKPFFLAVLIASAMPLHAAVISINFDNGGNTITGSTGAVNAGNWNALTFGAAGSPNSLSDLSDDSGGATTVDIDLQNASAGSGGGFDSALPNATGEMLNLYTERNRNGGALASVSQITYSTYDVYIYYGSTDITARLNDGSGDVDVALDANNDGSSFVLGTAGTTFDDTGAGNYYVFSGLTGSSFTLETGLDIGTQGTNNGFVYGMQIVEVIPEPSAALLGGLGAFLLLRRRRCV